MIESAINELGEKGGSSEENISQFIRKEYVDLPWAHDALLNYHLGNLCEFGSIIKTYNGLYMFPKVVTNQDSPSAYIPSTSIDADSRFSISPDCICSSNSWFDSSSSSSKRKRQMYTRGSKMQRGRRWSQNNRSNRGNAKCTEIAQMDKRRHRRSLKQFVSEDEVSKEKYRIDKELADAVKGQDQVQENMHETLESSRAENICSMSNVGKLESVREVKKLKPCNFVMEVVPEKDEGVKECDNRKLHDNLEGIEEHKAVLDQEHSVGRKRRGQPLKNSVKERKVEVNHTQTPGRSRGRPWKKDLSVEKVQPKEQQIQDTILEKITEVPVQKCDTSKKLIEVAEEHNQSQGNLCETLERSPWEIKMAKETENSKEEEKKLREQFNLGAEGVPENDEAAKGYDGQKELTKLLGSEEETQFKEPNWGLKQNQNNHQKGWGKLLNRGTQGRGVHKLYSCVPGRGRGRPHEKDILVEKTETKAKRAEITDAHELKFKRKTEVHKENHAINKESTKEVGNCDELERNMHGTLEWSLVDKTNFVKQVRKPGSDAEENIEIKMDCCKMEGQQQNGGIKEFNEQKEPENASEDEQNQSSKEMNEMNFEENLQKEQENEMQNQQLEEGLKDCCILEGEEQHVCGVKGFNGLKEPGGAFNEEEIQISEEKNELTFGENQPKRPENEEQKNQQHEDSLKPISEDKTDVAEMFGHNSQIQANIQSRGEYESIKKAIGFPDHSWDSVLRGCKTILNSSMEELKQMLREEKVLETAGNTQLKSVERSSHSQKSKSNGSCYIL